jgi:hypothetical protein
MPPLVEGGHWHSEIVGEFFDGEQPIEGFHGRILQPDPFSRMSFGLSVPSNCTPTPELDGLEAVFDQPDRHLEKPLMGKGFWPGW